MSSMGSCVPGAQLCPPSSVQPAASQTTMRASARRTSSRNWFPRPFPSWAPRIKPGVSMRSIGTRRVPSTQALLFGWSCTLNSCVDAGCAEVANSPVRLYCCEGEVGYLDGFECGGGEERALADVCLAYESYEGRHVYRAILRVWL